MKRYLQAIISLIAGLVLVFLVFEFFFWFNAPDTFYRFFVFGAFFEELLKLALALLLLKFGIRPLTTAFIGVGFGFGEQLTHFLYSNGSAGMIAPWMHIIAGVVMALLLKQAVERKTFKSYALAFVVPLLVHGIYNGILSILLWWYLY